MSIHLESQSMSIEKIDNAIFIEQLSEDSWGVDFKVETIMEDMDVMEYILENKLMGFKNKRTLNEFTNLGNMFFYYEDNSDKISILFYGNFPKNDTMMFVNNLNREYLIQINQISINEDLSTESNLIEKEEVKTLKITTNMKNRSVIQSIMDNSFLGFHSKQEVENFKNKGEIILNKSSIEHMK